MKKLVIIVLAVLFFRFSLVIVSSSQTTDSTNQNGKQDGKNKQQDQPIKIKSKPRAGPENCSQSSGTVVLKVTFDKSAKITDVKTFSPSGCDGFDRNAIKSAIEIKFSPAIKNGEPITLVKQVVYTFSF